MGDLDTESAARLIATASDIALVVDAEGVVRDFAIDKREFGITGLDNWVGRKWVDTVTTESRPKIEALIREAFAADRTRWRQVNHASQSGVDIPVLYSALRVANADRLVVFGRDLRTISSLQQRLIEAQQALEKDYARLRHLETRYRLLFQLSSEPVLVVDGASEKVLEANPAALTALDRLGHGLVGRRIAECFEEPASGAVEGLLTTVRATGRADEAELPGPDGDVAFLASVSLLRQETNWVCLVRLTRPNEAGRVEAGRSDAATLSRIVAAMPDAFVVTTKDGTIESCNAAFLDLIQIPTEDQVRGESLDSWLGRQGVDLNVMLANLADRGAVRLFATVIRGEYGTETEVEISASIVQAGGTGACAYVIRDVGRRVPALGAGGTEIPQSVEQLTELVGRVSMKDVVRQTTDMIEKLYIEAALEITGDNRASAAELLGLSRQSLYVKLRRFGLRDFSDGD